MTDYRKQQAEFRCRVEESQRMLWPDDNGTYDPFGKLKKAWDDWEARRRARNQARDEQLRISRGVKQ